MRWVTYASLTDGADRVGLVRAGDLFGLPRTSRLLDLLGDDGELMARAAAEAESDPYEILAFAGASLRAPIPVPPSIRDFLAFEAHVKTIREAQGMGVDASWYELPVFYFSNPAAVFGPQADIPISPGSQQFDYELEVAAVVGRGGSDLAPEEAEAHIAGYMVLCDWSARDLQFREMALRLGPAKGKDSATSMGPMLVTPDELEPWRSEGHLRLGMRASVNGTQYSDGNLGEVVRAADGLCLARDQAGARRRHRQRHGRLGVHP
jgi:2-keto-4-pentenoate hydratase/2-oxohepta-3-ene-1,7-dioic acid hydratase in catechol pathway